MPVRGPCSENSGQRSGTEVLGQVGASWPPHTAQDAPSCPQRSSAEILQILRVSWRTSRGQPQLLGAPAQQHHGAPCVQGWLLVYGRGVGTARVRRSAPRLTKRAPQVAHSRRVTAQHYRSQVGMCPVLRKASPARRHQRPRCPRRVPEHHVEDVPCLIVASGAAGVIPGDGERLMELSCSLSCSARLHEASTQPHKRRDVAGSTAPPTSSKPSAGTRERR